MPGCWGAVLRFEGRDAGERLDGMCVRDIRLLQPAEWGPARPEPAAALEVAYSIQCRYDDLTVQLIPDMIRQFVDLFAAARGWLVARPGPVEISG